MYPCSALLQGRPSRSAHKSQSFFSPSLLGFGIQLRAKGTSRGGACTYTVESISAFCHDRRPFRGGRQVRHEPPEWVGRTEQAGLRVEEVGRRRGGYAKKKKTRYYHRCFGHRAVNTPLATSPCLVSWPALLVVSRTLRSRRRRAASLDTNILSFPPPPGSQGVVSQAIPPTSHTLHIIPCNLLHPQLHCIIHLYT